MSIWKFLAPSQLWAPLGQRACLIYVSITRTEESYIDIAETQTLVVDNFMTSPYFCIRKERVIFYYIQQIYDHKYVMILKVLKKSSFRELTTFLIPNDQRKYTKPTFSNRNLMLIH